MVTTNTALTTIREGQQDDLLRIVAIHRGRTGDTDAELVALELLFEETVSDPLTTAEANDLIENLHIYRDDGSDNFESGADTLVVTVDTLSLITGTQTVTFGDGETNETEVSSVGSVDVFVAKYYSNGVLAWVKNAGGTEWDEGHDITFLSDGFCIVTGQFRGMAAFGQGENQGTQLVSAGSGDLFVAKYRPDGSLVWATSCGGAMPWATLPRMFSVATTWLHSLTT